METLNRRQLHGRGVLLAGALGAAWLGVGGPHERALAAPPAPAAGFTPARRQAYTDLVTALGGADGTQIDASRATWAADRFAAGYENRLPANQRQVDAILDSLGRGAGRGRLRSLAAGRRDDRDLAAQAAALAALPFSPTIEDDDYQPVPVIV